MKEPWEATSSMTDEKVATQPTDSESAELEQTSVQASVQAASAEVNTNPIPAQAEAGNYKKGHVTIGNFDIAIENPAGSTRKGVDANGKAWETKMQNAYGYIKGTESVDGDPLDVFLHTDMDEWNGRKVFIVDQTKPDGTFDEHKVMLGFNDKDDAMSAYFANYDETWAQTHPGLRISETNLEDFDKWIKSSHRKTKPFADYTNVSKVTDNAPTEYSPAEKKKSLGDRVKGVIDKVINSETMQQAFRANNTIRELQELMAAQLQNELLTAVDIELAQELDGMYQSLAKDAVDRFYMEHSDMQRPTNVKKTEPAETSDKGYTVDKRWHKDKGKYIFAVKFTDQMSREDFVALKQRVKEFGGYYSSWGKGGFIFDTEEAATKFAEAILDKTGAAIADNKPMSLSDMQEAYPAEASPEPSMQEQWDMLDALTAKLTKYLEAESVELYRNNAKEGFDFFHDSVTNAITKLMMTAWRSASAAMKPRQRASKKRCRTVKFYIPLISCPPDSDGHLTEAPNGPEGPDLIPTSDNVSSDRKDTKSLTDEQISGEESSLQPSDDKGDSETA